jgi:cell migration-inducing and hyaluronan-binding protein
MERKWGNDNAAGSVAYKTAAFKDRDGSLGLGPNSYVVIHDGVNNSIAVDTEACEIKPTWNAAVCRGDAGRMSFVNGRGFGFGGISREPAPAGELPPVKLSRKGKEYSIAVGTNVRANTEIKATTERKSMDLHVNELEAGNWVILEIPGFTTAASGAPQDSLDALRKASVTSYYKGADALWVKLVSPGDDERSGHGGGERMQVSR